MKILVTGFKPFNNRDINPSEMIVNSLDIKDVEIIKLILPFEYKLSEKILIDTVLKEKVDCILSIGQAGNVPWISIEEVAINLDSSLSQDNKHLLKDESGYGPIDEKIMANGENAYFSSLPTRKIVDAINKVGVNARLSYSAGTFICNHVMYIGGYLAKTYNLKQGFIHVPFLKEQLIDNSKGYSMEFEDMKKAIEVAIDVIIKENR